AGAPFLSIALEGLAKLVVDRAKQEAVGWFLDTTGDQLCGEDKPKLEQLEVSTYWMPQLCSLASTGRLSHYGAGAELLESLKANVEHDVRGWPGAFTGLAMGGVFWAEAKSRLFTAPTHPASNAKEADKKQYVADKAKYDAESSMWECDTKTYAPRGECTSLKAIRLQTSERFTSLLKGDDPRSVFAKWGDDLQAQNRHAHGDAQALYSKSTQLIACASSLPLAYAKHQELFKDALPSDEARAKAAWMAALTSAPACFTILGKGIPDEWKVFRENGDATPTPKTALDTPNGIERMTTLLRLNDVVKDTDAVVQSWKRLEEATLDYKKAVEEAAKAVRDLRTNPPVPPKEKITDVAAWKVELKELMASEQLAAQQRHVGAALTLAKASLRLGRSGIAFVHAMNKPALIPGFFPQASENDTYDDGFKKNLEAVDAQLGRVERDITTLESALMRDWSSLTAELLASLRVPEIAGGETKNWDKIEQQLATHLALLVAILRAKDGDAMAKALDAVASPPGGWRTKQEKGKKTFSIVAHPGLLVFGGE
ncbi:MAG TPA: hypothetical protein PK156_51430, partial [Polyangium sp.]|nr:hypothetical protein [Polyangium sp.]